jgi:hypothetical protein
VWIVDEAADRNAERFLPPNYSIRPWEIPHHSRDHSLQRDNKKIEMLGKASTSEKLQQLT